RTLVEIGRALAIGTAAAECGTFCKDLAVILVVAARTIFSRFTARMFLPVGAAFRELTGTVKFRTVSAVFTGPVEFRSFTKRAVTAGAIITRARKTRTFLTTTILALLPRLGIATI